MKTFRKQKPRPKKNTLITGKKAIIASFGEGIALERIFLLSDSRDPVFDEIKKLAVESGVPVSRVPVEKLNFFNVPDHEGCIAQRARVQYQDLQQVISFVVEKGEVPLLLLLDGITDIRNVGAIARSAYCFGVHAIVIPEKGVASLNEDAILTSAGALENIAVCRVNSLMKAVEDLHLNGIKVYATDMGAKTIIFDCDLSVPCAIVLGGEEHGIYPALQKICDASFQIPMTGDFDSLNVSVTAGITLYEVSRQRS